MGYASLNVPNNGSVLATTVLHDIVGCITGQFSSSAQLRGANTASSEIVNTLGQNWNIAYPSANNFVPTTPNNTLASWVLTAPCINPSKTKYIRLTNWAKGLNTGQNVINQSGTGATNQYTTSNVVWTVGILPQACLSASSQTSLVAETFYSTETTTNGSVVSACNLLNGNNIILSWSSRHFVIWSNNVSTTTNFMLYGYVEFPETDVTVAQNLIPATWLIERNTNLVGSVAVYAPGNTSNSIIGDILFPSYYNIRTSTLGPASFVGTANSTDISMSTVGTTPRTVNTIPTINNAGSNRLMLTPIIINMMSFGQPNMYLSSYSNMYIVANNLGNGGDTITVGTDTYAYLPSNTGMSFVVKRG